MFNRTPDTSFKGNQCFLLALGAGLITSAAANAQLPADANAQSFSANQPYQDEDYSEYFLAETVKRYFHTSISGGIRYDDNIFLTSEDEVDDVIWSVTPTFILNNGGVEAAVNTIEVRYRPSFQFYVDNSDRDSINHYFGSYYGLNLAKTQVRASVTYSDTEGSDRFVSGTVAKQLLNASLRVSRIVSEKTRLDAAVNARIDEFDSSGLIDNDGFDASLAAFYAYSPKTDLGVSLGYGVDNVDDGTDHDFYRVGANAIYKVSGKTNVVGRFGYEFREFDSSIDDNNDLFWSIGATHRLSDYTTLNATFYQNSDPSYNIEDSGYTAIGFSLGVHQLVTARTTWNASLAYENDDYFRTNIGGTDDLDNDYFLVNLGVDHLFSNGVTVGLFARWQVQDANVEQNDFDSFSFGLNASYNFW